MLIKIKKPWEISENNVTTLGHYKTRRDFIKATGIFDGGRNDGTI